ncbi:MAG TPA: hypothetical protein VN636_16370 [Acidimicrobiia bacterium]|nr:hypothetical protein [Acidimicrobiia bacterium]
MTQTAPAPSNFEMSRKRVVDALVEVAHAFADCSRDLAILELRGAPDAGPMEDAVGDLGEKLVETILAAEVLYAPPDVADAMLPTTEQLIRRAVGREDRLTSPTHPTR